MKNQINIAAMLLTTVMFFASCGNKTSESKEKTATEQTANANYQCPMKCEGEKIYSKPGSCPVCNMDLQLVEENHENHEHHKH
ncbi:MAG: hypothetical protein IPM48_08585 [Saprospiraceae bacterium]|nr:hypothetical protein [Saprospiraceae bacterium]